jgi:hypothetical protein
VKEWLNEQQITVLEWSAQSPDLNPIKNNWCEMDATLTALKMTTLNQLKDEMHRIWLKIPKDRCMKLVESMTGRVRACYYAKGGSEILII